MAGSGTTEVNRDTSGMSPRSFADFVLLGVTSVEVGLLLLLTPTFGITDWIYVSQHLLVLGIASLVVRRRRRIAHCLRTPRSS